ncbi:hypothetical protein KJ980_06545 [Patescibacteria group bacterium]|nr:hypothetical protein [Patescibacteria group bacterium]MBU4099278.1 hypothetical protein [Patescibacteria group bacterium]
MSKQIPYFLWDYDLSDEQVRAILHGQDEVEKAWLVGRILTHAKFDDVWKYLTIKDIVSIFPKLQLPKKIKHDWGRALDIWGYHVHTA